MWGIQFRVSGVGFLALRLATVKPPTKDKSDKLTIERDIMTQWNLQII